MTGKRTLMTESSATLSLFAEPSNSPRQPSSIVLSMLVHLAVTGVVYYGVTHLPRIHNRPLLELESVRRIDMRELDPNFPQMPDLHRGENRVPQPGADVIRQLDLGPSPQLSEEMHSFLGQVAGQAPGIRPAIHSQPSFADEVPRPNIKAWTPGVTPRRIMPPAQDLYAAAEIEPLPAAPNEAIRTAENPVPSTELLPPRSSASPVIASPFQNGLVQAMQTAATSVASSLESATAAATPSISSVPMLDETIVVPPVKEIAAKNPSDAASGRDIDPPHWSDRAKHEDVADMAIDGRRLSTEHIVLPRNGRFNVVAVGTSLDEEYPEATDIWADRVAYTAYLHVGLRKSWILQYSSTRALDMDEGGQVERLDAPWPYDILRPNLLPQDVRAGALMVHGVLNRAGRLESLAVASPNSFRYTSFVLRALSQWQFRPALEHGKATPVEVLLIIPEETD